jgi:ribose transport system ATP-binding protein
LRGIDLEVEKGEVHALVGANGAGKTTLCNIICGITDADSNSGDMQFSQCTHVPLSRKDAEAAGIRIVMQELNLIDDLSVAENLYFGSLPTKRGLVDFKKLYADSRAVLGDMGLDNVGPRVPLRELGVGQQQLIEIGRELMHPCKLLILDEPTAALTDPQIELLFEKIESLKANGTSVIYVSHRMGEIRRIADRVSVLRDGEAVLTSAVADISVEEIVRQMAEEPVRAFDRRGDKKVSTALKVRELSTKNLLRDINLDIHFGEILGIAGLMGSGRTELLRAIFAADELSAGYIQLSNSSQQLSLKSPVDAVAHGIGLIPEDRKQQGLLLQQSVKNNITLPSLRFFKKFAGWIDVGGEQEAVEEYRNSLDIKCDGIDQVVGQLSGGNQQKVSIARWLMRDCGVLLFDEPTRGIDIHAKTAIYALLDELAEQGKAVVIVSSESRELTDLCDRIAVMSHGRLAATFKRGEWTAEKIMAASFSEYQ